MGWKEPQAITTIPPSKLWDKSPKTLFAELEDRTITPSYQIPQSDLGFRCGSEEGSVRQPLRKEHKNI